MDADVNITACLKLAREPGVKRYVYRIALRAVGRATASAPVLTGAYKSAFGATLDSTPDAMATFYNSDKKAWLLEFGAPHTRTKSGTPNPVRAIGVLRSSCDALGLKVVTGSFRAVGR